MKNHNVIIVYRDCVETKMFHLSEQKIPSTYPSNSIFDAEYNINDVDALSIAQRIGVDMYKLNSFKDEDLETNLLHNFNDDCQKIDEIKSRFPNNGKENIFVFVGASFFDAKCFEHLDYDKNEIFIVPSDVNQNILSLADAVTASPCGGGVLLDVLLFIIDKFNIKHEAIEDLLVIYNEDGVVE